MDTIDKIRQKCWDRALESYGTGYVFGKRANRLRRQLRGLTFLGIVVPLVAGSIVLSFGKGALFPLLVGLAYILGLIQVVCSLWSLVGRWDDTYSYAIESLNSNYRLANNYQKLAENPPAKLADLQLRFDLLEKEDQLRSADDYKQATTEKEERKGMRAALRKFQRKCAGCGRVPISMKPSNCPVCGQF